MTGWERVIKEIGVPRTDAGGRDEEVTSSIIKYCDGLYYCNAI